MINFLAIPLIILLFLVVIALLKRPVGNYADPTGPFFQGKYALEQEAFDGRLKVISWNMHYGEKLEQAITALEDVPDLQDADVLLLQEMSSDEVDVLARRLYYNYIYYPAAFHRQRKEAYGNAILSKWPLYDPAKVVLPNGLPGWLQSRNAARARLDLGAREILVYSVHLDTTWMMIRRGVSQGEFIASETNQAKAFVILAGDFNTWNIASITMLENGLEQVGLARLSKGTGYTFESSGLRLTLDHIFSGNVVDASAGVYRQTQASDHYPVWAEMTLP